MRFGLTVHPGFESPILRTTCTLSGDLITGGGVFGLAVSFLVSGHRVDDRQAEAASEHMRDAEPSSVTAGGDAMTVFELEGEPAVTGSGVRRGSGR